MKITFCVLAEMKVHLLLIFNNVVQCYVIF
jgi:hypothetical protein